MPEVAEKLAGVPLSAAAHADWSKRPVLKRGWECRNCGERGDGGDKAERLCGLCFTAFNQGVGVGRECQRRDARHQRTVVDDYADKRAQEAHG